MKRPNKTVKLLAAGLVFLAGGLFPLTRGKPVNTGLLLLAAMFGILALILAARVGRSEKTNPPAG